ncbi:transglutaminase family protein [Amaricoccus sp.]|uniref:transglutaminase family protein n=1 Tax=Amaricoccus sp. TaxID=1872485 RepID=UPI001B4785D8|nr:transglutaminase family protein [Amaricoccus sp.]MBP7000678.1 transglutaminase family protein [Amaricoccus sp.]
MRLSVRHRTVYAFDAPMRWIVQSHRLTPSACASQRTLAWTVAADGGEIGAAFVDGAGDAVSTLTIVGPVERVEVLVEGEVETADTSGILRDHREIISPRAYLVATAATHPNRALAELADAAVKGASDADELARAHRLAAAVADAIAYAPGATDAHTTAAEALEQGKGVCQDHAHALIALAHRCGLPARYVSGYLYAGEEDAAAEASHAWAEIFVSRLGWIGFDAANRCCPDERYIRLGSGRDAREAAPIRGVSRGGGTEVLDVDVSVAQAPARSQSQTQQ